MAGCQKEKSRQGHHGHANQGAAPDQDYVAPQAYRGCLEGFYFGTIGDELRYHMLRPPVAAVPISIEASLPQESYEGTDESTRKRTRRKLDAEGKRCWPRSRRWMALRVNKTRHSVLTDHRAHEIGWRLPAAIWERRRPLPFCAKWPGELTRHPPLCRREPRSRTRE